MCLNFNIITTDDRARAGIISTTAGVILTPVFMPVATQGAIKTLTPEEVKSAGATILLANTYHLMQRPGAKIIQEAGGIARFMGWDGPVLTDSGGYQIFSMAEKRIIQSDGVYFRSYYDGAGAFLSPELALNLQEQFKSTIAMPLDVCPPANVNNEELIEAVKLTTMWLDRTLRARRETSPPVFGICQGGCNIQLRKSHLEEICSRNISGVALGGLSVGERNEETRMIIENIAHMMPVHKPRYLMGMGKPEDILHAIFNGIDMFDCVFPTRAGRHGLVLTSKGRYSIKLKRLERDSSPLDEDCECPVCQKFERRYLRHIYNVGELLSGRLLSLHNLYFYFNLMKRAREAILCYKFKEFYKNTMESLKITEEYENNDSGNKTTGKFSQIN